MNDRISSDPNPVHPQVLVIGSRGMLARDLLLLLSQSGVTAAGHDLPDIDITRFDGLLSTLEAIRPQVVVNCAAYTAVDKAESEPEIAFAVNRDGARNLAEACRSLAVPLIHISTDYVFDGFAERPYREDDPVNPLSVYGKSKWEGEEAVRSCLLQHLIVRTSWLFGANGHNFVKTVHRLATEREELRIVADQHGCPTWTVDLADALVAMIGKILADRHNVPWGTYHYCGACRTTWHGFARAIVEEARKSELPLKACRVVPIETKDYPTPAPRPRWSVLDCGRIEESFGIKPGNWQAGIPGVMIGST